MRDRQIEFARHGEPFDLFLMIEHHWTPQQVDALPNRMYRELLAAHRLRAERANRKWTRHR